MLDGDVVPSGLPATGAVPWGTHLCQFYRTTDDLRDALVPYFRAGLESGDQCLWVTSDPLASADARRALAQVVTELDGYERRGQLEIVDASQWYLRTEGLDTDAVLEMWLQREQRALARGFNGLRISGNTFFVERGEWNTFARYEAAVHRAFHGRKIVALCSYCLDRCTIDDVLDVLKNHQFALLRREGTWETVHSATHLLSALQESEGTACAGHSVYFYGQDRFPASAITDFFKDGLSKGGKAGAIATKVHLERLQEEFARRGVASEAVHFLDADELIDTCCGKGAPSGEAFRPALVNALEKISQGNGDLYLYGEIVGVLTARGQLGAAIELEAVWEELLRRRSARLMCGYDISALRGSDAQAVDGRVMICKMHDEVRIDAPLGDVNQVVGALAGELRSQTLRQRAARLSNGEQGASERLALLQRVTAALSEVRDSKDVSAVLQCNACAGVGTWNILVLPPGDCPGSRDHHDASWFHTAKEVQESALAEHGGFAAMAVLPMHVAGRCLGTILYGFFLSQSFKPAQRALLEDITRQVALTLERVGLWEETVRQKDHLEKASTGKDEFLAMLGHELRNPLAAIRTAAELLKLMPQEHKLERINDVLSRQATHMAKLVDGLLDVSRMARGKITLDKQIVNLSEILQETVQDRFSNLQADGVRLFVDLEPLELWVHGDRVRLAQVFDNLLSNALKFTEPPGSIMVRAHVDDGHAVIAVADSGSGIDAALLPNVFEPFRQGVQELARCSGGLGLGLCIVKRLIEQHGGEVSASSDGAGCGSEFIVRLPLAAPPSAVESSTPMSVQTRGLRVLVVEDSLDLAELLRDVLELREHECAVAADGESAPALAREFRPDVVLCDIGLPGKMDGYEVARVFRSSCDLQMTRLVAVTGYGRPEDVLQARQAGFDAHLTKPIDMDALESVLRGG